MSATAATPYAGAAALTAAAVATGLVLHRFEVGSVDIGLVFLTAILFCAIRFGLAPALTAVILSTLAYNFFFFAPYYTLRIADPGNAVTVFFFGLVAFIASNLAARVRTQTIAVEQHATMMENLYLFSRKLAEVFTLEDVLWVTAFQIAQMLRGRVVILLPEGSDLKVRGGYPPEDRLSENEMDAARLAWQGRPALAAQAAGTGCIYRLMQTGRGPIGVVRLERESAVALAADQERLLAAIADQAALAIERMNLAEEMDRARLAAEAEKLRSALFSSISHDLRTPLASILGSITSYRTGREKLPVADKEELLATIQDEAERLNRFIANLLDMTRLEAGAVRPQIVAIDVEDMVGSALRRASRVLDAHRVQISIAAGLPRVMVDPVLFEQVLFNLLDNAAKYSAQGSAITIAALDNSETVRLEISDEGPGIPPAERERIFDKFTRLELQDRRRAGTGLGLAICRGFVEGMKGKITAENRTDRSGTRFIINLPAERNAP
jgi:two-component system sensor histidine kinase KdpD